MTYKFRPILDPYDWLAFREQNGIRQGTATIVNFGGVVTASAQYYPHNKSIKMELNPDTEYPTSFTLYQ